MVVQEAGGRGSMVVQEGGGRGSMVGAMVVQQGPPSQRSSRRPPSLSTPHRHRPSSPSSSTSPSPPASLASLRAGLSPTILPHGRGGKVYN